tara:strand:+ start:264 stop:608 length:345 start_codon:yes stop_codon:yes gene_type:complete
MKVNKSLVWITTQFEGFHKYPNAPKGVEFLKNEHRHTFKLKVWIEVFHDDRDVEFILFKRFIDGCIKNNKFDFKSCEMISDDLQELIVKRYPGRDIAIEVSEDGENGSYKEYSK